MRGGRADPHHRLLPNLPSEELRGASEGQQVVTKHHRWQVDGTEYGVVGGTVGAPFALLVAEEFFASGCEALVSMTSVGLIAGDLRSPFFVVIDRGASWTTDAPFRETDRLIASRRAEGIFAVEMEPAALLAMGRTRQRPVVCLAHVTHAMATRPDDIEKGGHDGHEEALTVCARALATAVAYARSGTAGPRER